MNDEPTAHLDSEQEPPLLDWAVFSYLVAERADLYRAVIDVFADAKAEFSLHLRSGEIRAALTRKGWEVETTDVESTLGQLEAWGNLQSYQDNSDVASLAEYYRKRLLYQLTAEGEAALASSQNFAEQLSRAAKLDVRALERIVSAAGQMQRLVNSLRRAEPLDSAVVLTTLRNICQDAEELTSRAQSFFRWLHEQTEAERGDLESFLAYKQQLIDYLQDFVGELILRGGEIAGHLGAITDDELQALSEAAAEEDVGPPVAGQQEEHGRRVRGAAARWRFRLAGLIGWFVHRGGRPAQSEQLRSAARAAIPRLLQLASQMNERQSGRSDRVADLRRLAGSFLACRDDDEAHELFRAAFSLTPARHLRIDVETLIQRDQQPDAAKRRWIDAEPVVIHPSLRESGRGPAAASNRRVTDRSAARAALQRKLTLESKRDDASRETLVALGRRKLSGIGRLDRDALEMLVHLIERTPPRFDGKVRSNASPRVGRSKDGRVQIRLWREPNEDGGVPHEGELATIESDVGSLMLRDEWMEVTRVG